MPYDGIVTKCIVNELNNLIPNGRIDKINQPEKDEIHIIIRAKGKNQKLLLSANSSYARVHITSIAKSNPLNAPLFCMILRKHLIGAKIVNIDFLDYERIIKFTFENSTELGELSTKHLIVEVMGKYSNIILTTHNNKIIDAIKHIDSDISSKREILPAREYENPPKQDKTSPAKFAKEKHLVDNIFTSLQDFEMPIYKVLLNNIKGFSPLVCNEICSSVNINPNTKTSTLTISDITAVKDKLLNVLSRMENNDFKPCIIYNNAQKPIDFHCLSILENWHIQTYELLSKVLDVFYTERDLLIHLDQKKSNLLKLITNNIARCNKKIAIHSQNLQKSSDNEKLKLYGELLIANLHNISKNVDKVSLLNYYSENNEYIEIPVKNNFSPQANAQLYFKKYTKAKNSFIESTKQLKIAQDELNYLESVLHNLENALTIEEINDVREELISQNYLAKTNKRKKASMKSSKPYHFRSSDGFDIYVGKNNMQNDQLTLKTSSSNDIWLHTKDIHGSHVIIKVQNKGNIPDSTLTEAAIICAYFSKAKMSSNVPVDYTKVKNVKKPSGAKPGMVIYVNNKTINVHPDEQLVSELRID